MQAEVQKAEPWYVPIAIATERFISTRVLRYSPVKVDFEAENETCAPKHPFVNGGCIDGALNGVYSRRGGQQAATTLVAVAE